MTRIQSSLRLAAALAAALGASATLAVAAEPQAFSYETYDPDALVVSRGVALGEPVIVEQEQSVDTADRAGAERRQPATRFLADETQLGADVGH